MGPDELELTPAEREAILRALPWERRMREMEIRLSQRAALIARLRVLVAELRRENRRLRHAAELDGAEIGGEA